MGLNSPTLPAKACKGPSTNRKAIGQEVGGTGLSERLCELARIGEALVIPVVAGVRPVSRKDLG